MPRAINLTLIGFMMACVANGVAAADKAVLIIGDSISIGYTAAVRESLQGEAVIDHNEGNAQDTRNGLRMIDQWLGSQRWDLITFNFGLWDMCYRLPGPASPENRDKVRGAIAVPLEEYRANLELLAMRLQATGAKLVFQATTSVPEGEPCRFAADLTRYNRAAMEVMKSLAIPVNDLSAVTDALPLEMYESAGNVHYTEQGYKEIADSVAKSIRSNL